MTDLMDTDHFSLLQHPTRQATQRLLKRLAAANPGDVGVSAVSFHEQVLGANAYIAQACSPADLIDGYRLLIQIHRDYAAAVVVPFDQPAADTLTRLIAAGVRIKAMDLRIAAVALANDLTLLTRNRRDFAKVPGLRLDDWTV